MAGFATAQPQSRDTGWLACQNVAAYINLLDYPDWHYVLEGSTFIESPDEWRAVATAFMAGRGLIVDAQTRDLPEIDGGKLFLFTFENQETIVIYEQAPALVDWPVLVCAFSIHGPSGTTNDSQVAATTVEGFWTLLKQIWYGFHHHYA